MKKALGDLLLSARKSRARRPLHFHQSRPPLHIGCRQKYQSDESPVSFFIPNVFCFTNVSASSNSADLLFTPFAAATYPLCPLWLFHPTALHDSTPEVPKDPGCVAPAEKIPTRDFSHGVAHCDLSTAQYARQELSNNEARKLLRLVKLENFKKNLHSTGKNFLPVEEAVNLCKQTGAAINDSEAEEILKSLDEAGTILLFRRKVFLEPEKVAQLLARVMPLPLVQEDDPRNQELLRLQKEKEEIDLTAHKQVRRMLWSALGAFSAQSAIFFRLTFWDLSWDVMEPITFFVTSSSILAGFFFFVMTRRDPSYLSLMDSLFSSKQRKLMRKRNFNVDRFLELQGLGCLPAGGHWLPKQ